MQTINNSRIIPTIKGAPNRLAVAVHPIANRNMIPMNNPKVLSIFSIMSLGFVCNPDNYQNCPEYKE